MVGSFLSIDTRIMTSQWRNNTWLTWKCRFSAKYRPKFIFFLLKKFQISKFHRLFAYKRREVVFLKCSVSFRSISWRYFSNWQLKIFSCGNHPRTLGLCQLTLPRVRGEPTDFFSSFFFKYVKEVTLPPPNGLLPITPKGKTKWWSSSKFQNCQWFIMIWPRNT